MSSLTHNCYTRAYVCLRVKYFPEDARTGTLLPRYLSLNYAIAFLYSLLYQCSGRGNHSMRLQELFIIQYALQVFIYCQQVYL